MIAGSQNIRFTTPVGSVVMSLSDVWTVVSAGRAGGQSMSGFYKDFSSGNIQIDSASADGTVVLGAFTDIATADGTDCLNIATDMGSVVATSAQILYADGISYSEFPCSDATVGSLADAYWGDMTSAVVQSSDPVGATTPVFKLTAATPNVILPDGLILKL